MSAQASSPEAEGGGPEYYASHLAAVDARNAVVSTEDIFNARGALVVRKGTRISESVASRILQHKLTKPLQEQVQLSSLVDNSTLREHFDRLLADFPDLAQMLEELSLLREFQAQVLSVWLPPLLAQNLTVLADRKPAVYAKGLFAAALSSILARELGLGREELNAAFIAALAHDIGLLHIDPAVLAKDTALDASEWRAIQSHVVIGKVMLEKMPGLPPATAQAVLEHHERCDGSGYPLGKTEEQLASLGQVVAMADSLQAIRTNQFARQGLNLANAVPYLQMNSTTHTYAVYEAMRGALKRSRLQPQPFREFEAAEAVAAQLLQHGRALSEALAPLEEVHRAIAADPSGRWGRTLDRLASRVLSMLYASGLLREELIGWLDEVCRGGGGGDLLAELNTVELMQQELRWQLGSVRRSLDEYLQKRAADGATYPPQLATALERISDCLRRLDP